jgi:hypothetical protein
MMKAFLLPLSLLLALPAEAALRPERVHVADAKKTKAYIRDGLIVGGDKAIDEVVVKGIRRASNAGFERIVIDLEGLSNGEPSAIPRAPYFQVAVTPDEKRIVLTLFGAPKLAFDSRKVLASFRKSAVVRKVELLPMLEPDSWTMSFELKKGTYPVEVFELTSPVRLIMDVRARK